MYTLVGIHSRRSSSRWDYSIQADRPP